jgi:hypothetical protein
MKLNGELRKISSVVAVAVFGFAFVQVIPASAATKTITCYKGTITKKVSTAKCPSGNSTKKPSVKNAAPSASAAIAFQGNYTGKVSLLWGDGYVQVTSVKANGTGNVGDLAELNGTGSAAPASQCDSFAGSGTLGTGANTMKVAFDTSAKGCAADDTAPTKITFTGNAVIKSGTGKYATAKGTFKVSGSFSIHSNVISHSISCDHQFCGRIIYQIESQYSINFDDGCRFFLLH